MIFFIHKPLLSEPYKATMLGLSLRMWSSSDSSCCIIFSSPSDSLVDTLLAVLQNSDGVGQASDNLLQVIHSMYKGRFFQNGNFACFVSLKKKLCWTAVAKFDLLRMFCGEHDLLIILVISPNSSSIHNNALQCIQNAPKNCIAF